jgi:hypothetical protein
LICTVPKTLEVLLQKIFIVLTELFPLVRILLSRSALLSTLHSTTVDLSSASPALLGIFGNATGEMAEAIIFSNKVEYMAGGNSSMRPALLKLALTSCLAEPLGTSESCLPSKQL